MNQKTRVTVRVQPGAKRTEIVRFRDGVWHIKLAAAPEKGKANRELIEFLSDLLGVSKSQISIEKGTTGKTKVVAVGTLTPRQVTERLSGR